MKRNIGLEDRVKCLEGALRECTQQLQFVHKEQEKQRTHEETVVTTKTKTTMQPKYDELCAEMNAQLAKASQLVAYTRNELSVSQAHANSLTLALKVSHEKPIEWTYFHIWRFFQTSWFC
jgi:hypothetical protein